MVETSDTESDDNQMVLEAVLCVKRDLETVSGDKIKVAAAAKYADKGTIVVGSPVEIEVTDTLLYDEKDRHQTARLYPLDHTPTVNFNNRTVWSINITLTEMTAVYNIIIETVPSGTKALVAIDRVRAHYFGIGNCGIDDVGFKTIQNSSVAKTTQITNVSLTTWPVTNTLTSARDQWSTPRKSDSTLTISFESVICEDSSALKNSLVKFLVNVSRLGKEVATFERHFKRDITKKTPKLSLNISVLNNATEAVRSGQTLSVEVAVNHTAASSAWAKTVIITVLIPPFLKYMSVITSKPKAVNGTVVTEGIQFKIPLVYFVDTYKWTFNLTVDPDKFFERGTPNKTVTLIADAVYKGRTATSYATEMAFAKFTLETEECNDMLGLEDKTIKDCQIFASTSISNSARFVRLNTESGSQGWQFLNRGPTFEGLEFIQIKIGNQALITGISIQSAANDYSSYPTTFRVKYSEESMFWQDVINSTSGKPKLFTVILGETQDAAETAYIDLGEDSFKARYVRLMPVSNSKSSDRFVMRMELHGCLTTDDVNATEVCKADTAITYPSDYYERGYIVDTSTCHLYVCAIPAAGQLPVCSFTTDKGKSWSPIDDSVINIHCLENATKRLVGLSKNLKSRVMSKNGGETWNAHPDADCSKLNQQDLIRSKPLSYENSFTDKPGDSPENWNCPSLDVKWGVTKNGLYVSESGSWSQTCVASFGVPCN
ncbi:uncharacterized protein LOC135491476 [Lineus longissimus]|uniref:uncharacterized protein LOC135491476 n=1 Tax=Lineus longissimus TaxID=88925 RepID=UPI00315C93C3